MPSHLLWLLTKDNNSFLVKRNGVTFSRAPGNLTGKNTLNQSFLACHKTISMKKTKNVKKDNRTVLHVTLRNRYNPGRTSVKAHKLVVNTKRATFAQISKLFNKFYKNTTSLKLRKAMTLKALARASALLKKN